MNRKHLIALIGAGIGVVAGFRTAVRGKTRTAADRAALRRNLHTLFLAANIALIVTIALLAAGLPRACRGWDPCSAYRRCAPGLQCRQGCCLPADAAPEPPRWW
jgi:hypothetical protein